MKVIRNVKIGTKIFSLVAVLIGLTTLVAGFGIIKMGHIGEEIKEIAEEDLPLIEVLTEITTAQLEQAIWFERALRFGEVLAAKDVAKEGLAHAEEEFEKLAKFADEELLKAEEMAEEAIGLARTTEEKNEHQEVLEHLKVIDQEHHDYEKHVLEVFALIHQARLHEAELLAEKIEQEEDDLNHELEQFLRKTEKFTEESALKAEHDEEAAVKGMLIVTASALGLGIMLGTFITRAITRPLRQAVDVSNTIAKGDLAVKIDVDSTDETGQLLGAMQNMVTNLKGTVQVAEQIAQGDLDVSVNVLSDRDTLGKSLSSMLEKLRVIVTDVKNAANNVAGGSQQMSSGSEELSQGATEQASSAEEVSSSIEQMAANIRQNADNALQTEKIAVQSALDARESGEAVAQTVSAMQEIAKQISIVEEIARQTHTLSLNATIEAAKAEEYGKGFAVVAAEVRALAERSRTAAGEINHMMNESVTVAEKAGAKLTRLVPDIQKTAELVQEISSACTEQNAGTEQINNAVQQLNQVIQQNSSASEEMASTSEELASQAEQLKNTIAFFKIGEGARKAPNKADQMPVAIREQLSPELLVQMLGQNIGKSSAPKTGNGNGKPDGCSIDMVPAADSGPDKLDEEFERF